MHYQDRIKTAASIITDFLRQYQRPSHLDNEAAMREIAAIAEELNALVSTSSSPDEFKGRVIDACRILRQTYTQRAWPMPAHFIKAMEAVAAKVNKSVSADAKVATFGSAQQIAAQRIIEGEPVGDGWLYGRLALDLLNSGLVSEAELSRYRESLRRSAERVFGADQTARMFARLEQRHRDAIEGAEGR